MGLDITAYRKLVAAPAAKLDGGGYPIDWDNVVRIWPTQLEWTEKNWPGRSVGVTAGVFTFSECFAFGAGAYSTYNRWRDELTRFAFPEQRGLMRERASEFVWERDIKGPFVELIDFADNEGVIGPAVAAKLAKDFADHQDRANASRQACSSLWGEAYTNWRRAFEMAADAGAVLFH